MSLSQLFAGGSGHEDDEAAGQIRLVFRAD